MLLMYGYKIVTTEFGLKSTELIKPSSRRVQYTDLVATRNDMTTANYSYEANEEKLVYCAMVAVLCLSLRTFVALRCDVVFMPVSL